ncbi:hypothetical protein [Paenibacillus amylolyticus]|uniref:hypothetical protein n=1 Tax=Paenibacillus amylolyticus TaxID=1451 RepID=UPI00286A7BDB|nr:hypothetical protein [Paenibacillus amylolyticus]
MNVQKGRFSVPRRWDEARNGVAERRLREQPHVSEGNKLRKHPLISAEFHIRC